MATVDPFIVMLANAVPCYYHPRQINEGISFKKCNTMVHGKMGHFATVYNQPTLERIKIVAKEWLADDWCRSVGVKKTKRFGGKPGLEYYIAYGSTGSDYQTALKALRIIKNHPSLPPCSE